MYLKQWFENRIRPPGLANWTGMTSNWGQTAWTGSPTGEPDGKFFFFFLHSIKRMSFWRVYRLPESLETGNPRCLSPPLVAAVGVPLHLPLTCRRPWHPDGVHRQPLQAGNLWRWKLTKLFPVPHSVGSRQSSLLLLIGKASVGRRPRLVSLLADGRCCQNLRI